MSSLVGLVFDCCLYCSLLLRCRLTPGFFTSATPHFTRCKIRTPAHPHFATGLHPFIYIANC